MIFNYRNIDINQIMAFEVFVCLMLNGCMF